MTIRLSPPRWIDIAGDRRGTSVIELGLALPLLMLFLIGIIDTSRRLSEQITLQQAAARAIERIQVIGQQPTYEPVRQEAATAAGVPVADVSIDNWLECNGVRAAATATTCAANETMARYLQVGIETTYEPLFYNQIGGPLTANAVLRIG